MRRTRGLRLGSIGGVPLTLTAGWALIAVVMTLVFTPVVENRLDLPLPGAVAVAFGVPILLAVSVLIHEVAHGVTAQVSGYRVREYVITLWGGHTTFMSEIDRPGASAAVAAAGPLTNLALAAAGWWIAPTLGPIGAFLAITLALTNGFVGLFNLLPASPLDGGRLLEAAIWRATGDRWLGMRVAGRLGQVTAVLVVAGFVVWPYFTATQGTFTVITGVIVGMVIWQGASQTVKAARARASAEGFDLAPYLLPVLLLRPTDPVSAVTALPAVVADDTGRGYALIDEQALRAVPADHRASTPVTAIQAAVTVCPVTQRAGSAAVSQIARGLSGGAKVFLYLPEGHPELPAARLIDIERVLVELKTRSV